MRRTYLRKAAPACVLCLALLIFAVARGTLRGQVASWPYFSDVAAGSEGEADIRLVWERGIVQGYPDGTYRPDTLLTRAEFTKMMVLALHAEKEVDDAVAGGKAQQFPDVAADAWFGRYVAYARLHAILEGYPDGTFGAGNRITTAEALKVFAGVFGLRADFPVDDEPWYLKYAVASAPHMPSTMKQPGQQVNRRQLAQMIASALRARETVAQREEDHAAAPAAAPQQQPANLQNAYNETLMRMLQQMGYNGGQQTSQNPSQAQQGLQSAQSSAATGNGTGGGGQSSGTQASSVAQCVTCPAPPPGCQYVIGCTCQGLTCPQQQSSAAQQQQSSAAQQAASSAPVQQSSAAQQAASSAPALCSYGGVVDDNDHVLAIGTDARIIAFKASPGGQQMNVLVHDRDREDPPAIAAEGKRVAVSGNGRYLLYVAPGPSLRLYDREQRTTRAIASLDATQLRLSRDGRYASFVADGCVLVHDRQEDVTKLIAHKGSAACMNGVAHPVQDGAQQEGDLTLATVTPDGSTVVYVVPVFNHSTGGTSDEQADLVLRPLGGGSARRIPVRTIPLNYSIYASDNARWIAFDGRLVNTTSAYLVDTLADPVQASQIQGSPLTKTVRGISDDGRTVLFEGWFQFYVHDTVTHASRLVLDRANTSYQNIFHPVLSGDGGTVGFLYTGQYDYSSGGQPSGAARLNVATGQIIEAPRGIACGG